MIRGVRAYDLTAHVNPPVRADPGVPLGGDAGSHARAQLARQFDKRESILHGRQIGSILPSHLPFAGTADCGSGGRWFEPTQLYQQSAHLLSL